MLHPTRRTVWSAVRALLGGPPSERRLVRYWLGEQAARWIGRCWVPEDLQAWREDEVFLRAYRRFEPRNLRSAERKFAVYQLANAQADIPGDTAECGVYRGATSYFICLAGLSGTHHVFDSFAGLSLPEGADAPAPKNVASWTAGELSASLEEVQRNLAEFDRVAYHPGWIPQRFADVENRQFRLVHIDVDLYQPTRDSLEFFYPRLVPHGMLICDDYGYLNCPGARRACDDFAEQITEPMIHLPTGQALLIKR